MSYIMMTIWKATMILKTKLMKYMKKGRRRNNKKQILAV